MSTRLQLFEQLERNLPPAWLKQLRRGSGISYEFLWALAGVLDNARASIVAARNQAIPARSDGFWLSLHLLGLGLQRRAGENDSSAFRRYQFEFEPTRNTREGLLTLIQELSGLQNGQIKLETDFEAGRYGELRIVVDLAGTWQNYQWWWLGDLFDRYIANGIQPLLDLSLCNLSSRPLPGWAFSTQFPASYSNLGPIWERPAFYDPLRLDFARNLIAFINPDDWESDTPRLEKLYQESGQPNPGRQFYYLTDGADACAQFLEIDYSIPESVSGEILFEPRPFEVYGWQFNDVFPRQGAQDLVETSSSTIDISGNGLDDCAAFPAYINADVTLTLPSADGWSTASTNYSTDSANYSALTVIEPIEGLSIAADRFGLTYWFFYGDRRETIVTETRTPIPDYVQVGFEEPKVQTVSYQSWDLSGNYQQADVFSLGTVSEPIPSADSWSALGASLGTPRLDENDTLQIADFQEFGGYFFVYNADVAITETLQIDAAPMVGYIPNCRTEFTDGRITRWLEVEATLEEEFTGKDSLELLGNGPWKLRLGSGSPAWGDVVPSGIGNLQQEFANLDPTSVWWTNQDGSARLTTPKLFGDNAIAYLALEFLLPSGQERLLRELELRVGYVQPEVLVQEGTPILSENWTVPDEDALTFPVAAAEFQLNAQRPTLDVVHYRRMDIDLDAHINLGVQVRISTRLRPPEQTITYPAFRTGAGAMGDPLRDRDYIVLI